MKQAFFGSMSILLALLAVASLGFAYEKADYEKLIQTNNCRNCDLTSAPLSRLDLSYADLRGSWLTYANFYKATLFKAKLPRSNNFRGANFVGAMWVDGAICREGSVGTCTCRPGDYGDDPCDSDVK